MVFNLYVVEELTHAEIAEKLEISVGTSKSNLAKARKKVQELVSRHQDIHLKSKRDG
jgi:DNA-directed RNA polymerase specialized sigma24 family protein